MTNSESKTPEVGDVWVNKNQTKYYIFNVFEDKLIRGFSVSTGRMQSFCLLTEDFIQIYKYLGKAVGSIDDLFKVKSFNEKQYYKDMFGEEND